jgi:hypothetical protein
MFSERLCRTAIVPGISSAIILTDGTIEVCSVFLHLLKRKDIIYQYSKETSSKSAEETKRDVMVPESGAQKRHRDVGSAIASSDHSLPTRFVALSSAYMWPIDV